MIRLFFGEPKGEVLKASNLLNAFSIVYRFRFVPIKRRGSDGFFYTFGKPRGVLIKRVHCGETWYHLPEDYLEWKSFLNIQPDEQILND